jgi:hypothetical protein
VATDQADRSLFADRTMNSAALECIRPALDLAEIG